MTAQPQILEVLLKHVQEFSTMENLDFLRASYIPWLAVTKGKHLTSSRPHQQETRQGPLKAIARYIKAFRALTLKICC